MASWSGYLSAKSIGSVVTQVSAQNKKEIIENRNYLKQIIDIVLYLTCQGISFRGHDETKDSLNQGNKVLNLSVECSILCLTVCLLLICYYHYYKSFI